MNVIRPTRQEREEINKEFDFESRDVLDATRETARSKMAIRKSYVFLELMIPVYDRHTGFMRVEEIDFLVGKKHIVTIQQNDGNPISELFNEASQNARTKRSLLGKGPVHTLHEMLRTTLENTYPMIDHVNDDIELLKREIFREGSSKDIVRDILTIRRNVTDMRKAMRGHASVLEHFLKRKKQVPLQYTSQVAERFEELVDEANEIWESLETEKEMVEALEDANEAIIAHRLNSIMRTLTTFSVILLPAGVVAGMWGMNVDAIPFVGQPFDFWIVTGIIGLVSLTLFLFFWTKQWLR